MKTLHRTRARLLALLLLSCWITLFVPACGLFKLKSQGTKTSPANCTENEVWSSMLNRCEVITCPVGQFKDREVCVERCPLGTVPWLVSDAGQRHSYACSSALELRDIIAGAHLLIDERREQTFESEQAAAGNTRFIENLQAAIERAKVALKRLPASMTGCPLVEASDGEPDCREGARWIEKIERCVFLSCPNQGVISRGECFERCFPGEHAWEPSPTRGQECATRLELSDAAAVYEYYLKHPEKRTAAWASTEERGVRAKAALARIDQSPPEPTPPSRVVLFYGRCQNSPDYDPRLHRDGPPQPGEEDDRRDGPPPPDEDDDDPDDGPPPPDEDYHR